MSEIMQNRYASPIGELLLAWREDQLVSLDYEDFEERYVRLLRKRFPRTALATRAIPGPISNALDDYFAGKFQAVNALKVGFSGTAFENRVWQALRGIGPGITATYGQMAAALNAPNAARAVGRANSMNPVAIVVPCHRVIGASAKLTGYAGGLERKRWLLEHERKHA